MHTLLGAILRRVAIGAQVELHVFGRHLLNIGNEAVLTNPYSVFGM